MDTALKELKKRVEDRPDVRIILFTGKGGVGKTTTAAGHGAAVSPTAA